MCQQKACNIKRNTMVKGQHVITQTYIIRRLDHFISQPVYAAYLDDLWPM